MNGVPTTPLSACGIGEALVALRARGLDRAPMTQALSAEGMRRRAQQFSPQRRALLVEVLRAQCGPQPREEHMALLERLAQSDSVTVTAGHQLVTGVGPLYVHAKIAETQALAEHWTQQGIPTVPVFWMATEDHDLEEIRRVFWRGRAVGGWAQPAEPLRSGAVPAERAARALHDWREQAALPEPVRAAAERSEAVYRASETLADATRELIGLMHPGVLVLDASDARLKASAAELWEDEIRNQTLYATRESASTPWGAAEPPVPFRPSALFALDAQGGRYRLDRREDGTWVRSDGTSLGRDADVAAWARQHPEQVSPNALLRPVYQEWILPNAAYTGGAGELAYAYQLAPYFARTAMEHGVWRLRHSGAWWPAAAVKAREGLRQLAETCEAVPPSWCGPWNPANLRNQLMTWLGAPDRAARPVTDALEALVRQTYAQPGLERSVEAWVQRIAREEDRMRERLRREHARREAVQLRRLDLLSSVLMPANTLQERLWTHLDLVEHGGADAVQEYLRAYRESPRWDAPAWWEFS